MPGRPGPQGLLQLVDHSRPLVVATLEPSFVPFCAVSAGGTNPGALPPLPLEREGMRCSHWRRPFSNREDREGRGLAGGSAQEQWSKAGEGGGGGGGRKSPPKK